MCGSRIALPVFYIADYGIECLFTENQMKRLSTLLAIAVCAFAQTTPPAPAKKAPAAPAKKEAEPPAPDREPGLYMIMNTSMGTITAQLFEKETPGTVANFVALTRG